MPKRKFSSDDENDSETSTHSPPKVPKKKSVFKPIIVAQPRIKLESLPVIKSLADLISVAETNKFYKNINMLVLWDILPYLKDLQMMIGMRSLKESVFYQIIYYLQDMHLRNIDGDYLHTIITGKPGSGKTTVSKIIGKIYQHLGVLSKKGTFRIAYRDDFVGQYLGETSIKTKKLLNSCLGGCLFVDEIYSLGPGQKDKDSYSKEAIDSINAFLSEHKNDFCFIGAGYKEAIDKCFFSVNEGLNRRFQWRHDIEDYTNEDLVEIFIKMVKEIKWELNVDKKDLMDIITSNLEFFKDGGGSCENLLTKLKIVHSQRVLGLEKSFRFKITLDDIKEAIKLVKKYSSVKEVRRYDYYT